LGQHLEKVYTSTYIYRTFGKYMYSFISIPSIDPMFNSSLTHSPYA